eukprot:1067312-Alexandrium_andersonii.AAC.1
MRSSSAPGRSPASSRCGPSPRSPSATSLGYSRLLSHPRPPRVGSGRAASASGPYVLLLAAMHDELLALDVGGAYPLKSPDAGGSGGAQAPESPDAGGRVCGPVAPSLTAGLGALPL